MGDEANRQYRMTHVKKEAGVGQSLSHDYFTNKVVHLNDGADEQEEEKKSDAKEKVKSPNGKTILRDFTKEFHRQSSSEHDLLKNVDTATELPTPSGLKSFGLMKTESIN